MGLPWGREVPSELSAHFGIGHYPSPDEWLFEVKADTILAFFGYNESFDGLARVDNFKAELAAFVDHTLSQAYNGRTAPRLILVTPIAFEDRTDAYDLPKGEEENRRLQAYARAVLEVAREKRVGAVDVFGPTREWFAAGGAKLTINGCHLSDAGYARLAPFSARSHLRSRCRHLDRRPRTLRAAVEDKDWFWFNDYRMLNGVHVYGQRYKPFGNVNYPEEIEKMRQMTRLRDVRIWDMAGGKASASATLPSVPDQQTRPLTPIESNFKKPIEYLGRESAGALHDAGQLQD